MPIFATKVSFLIKDWHEKEFDRLEKQKITPWAFYTVKGVDILRPDGSHGWRYEGIEFGGQQSEQFWGEFLRVHIEDITERSFTHTKAICVEHHLDSKIPLEETAQSLRFGLSKTLTRMVDIDRKLRGKGFPKDVVPHDSMVEETAMTNLINSRLKSELELRNAFREWLQNHKILAGALTAGAAAIVVGIIKLILG